MIEEYKGLPLLEKRLSEKMSAREGVGFDPLTIILIIGAIVPIIQNCFKASPKALRRRLLNRVRVAVALRKEGMDWGKCYQVADDLFDLSDKATDEELEVLIEDCCGKKD